MMREQGSRDWRMLAVAVMLWIASLTGHALFQLLTAQEHDLSSHMVSGLGGCALVALTAVIVAGFLMRCGWAGVAAVCTCAMIVGLLTALLADLCAWTDPAAVQLRQDAHSALIRGHAISPPEASEQRDYDCRIDLRLVSVNGEASHAEARLYASIPSCERLVHGTVYELQARFQYPRYGGEKVWLLHGESMLLKPIRSPAWPRRVSNRMQESFFSVTSRLSEQGQVLVPGLTMGVLGQDHISVQGGSASVDDTYARRLEEGFRRSGIMHLMAVSGGHFVLLAGMVRKACRCLLVDRRVVAVLVVGTHMALAGLMFPSDSVIRALVMGLISATAYAIGRGAQVLSALSWTVIVVIVMKPEMAQSYGFALSCAAVLGIALWCGRCARLLAQLMPSMLAEAVAMTICAQIFTLPIQVLMEPQLPVLSVPANVLVAPCVAFATIAGLLALAFAWCAPSIAECCARVSAIGTRIMEFVALGLGNGRMAVMPWAGGPIGAFMLLGVEIIAAVLIRIAIRAWTAPQSDRGLPGQCMGSARRVRLVLWWRQTMTMLGVCPTIRGD